MDAPPSQIGGMLFGYDIGVSSGALVSLTTAASSNTDWGTGLDPLTVGLVVSSSLMGALAGSVGVLLQGDRLGRRTELLAAAGLYGGCIRPQGCMAGASGPPCLHEFDQKSYWDPCLYMVMFDGQWVMNFLCRPWCCFGSMRRQPAASSTGTGNLRLWYR